MQSSELACFYMLHLNPEDPSASVVSSISSQFKLELWNIDYLYQDRKQNLWVGTNDLGLYCFFWNAETQQFDHFEKYFRKPVKSTPFFPLWLAWKPFPAQPVCARARLKFVLDREAIPCVHAGTSV